MDPRKPNDKRTIFVIAAIVLGIAGFTLITNHQALQTIVTAFGGLVAGQAPVAAPTRVFTDQNRYYQMDVPANWTYKSGQADHAYFDEFLSPDGNALIENVVYVASTPLAAPQLGQTALQLLGQFYAPGGQDGSIQLTDDSPQPDGSERLTWNLSSGGRSGESFIEVRNQQTLLLLTVVWADAYKSQYVPILDEAVSSYRAP